MNRPLSSQVRDVTRVGLLAALLLAFAALTVLATSARGDVIKPLVVLGPTTVANGTAVVSGTVAAPASGAQLTINGQPVGLQSDGTFSATVNLAGQSNLNLAVENPLTGETTTTNIPLTTNIVGPGGVIGPGVLSAIEQAGATLLKPIDGFKILDGLPLEVGGSVLNRDNLAGLTVNGTDVLGLLGPDGAFKLQVPGTTREITVSATDRQGVTQTSVFPVQHISTTGAAPVGRTVNAAGAVGVRIASVRYRLKGIKRTKRLTVVVTVKDRRGLLVRSAAVGVRSAKVRAIRKNPKAKRTNIRGQSAFVLKVRNRSFGKRLRLVIVAKTPQAKQRKASSVRLPRLAKRPASRR
jgi:hypothetical protein